MRLFINVVHAAVLIALSILAKDNLVAVWHQVTESPRRGSSLPLPSTASIEVAFSPSGGATEAIIKALSEAQSSILVAAYSFTSKELAEALLAAKKRNIPIKVVLDRSQASQRYSSATFFTNMGFALRIDRNHRLYHNKFMIIDDRTVITGSFNFTKAAETKNAENILIIRNYPQLAQRYTKNFLTHWQQSISAEEFTATK